MLHTFIIHSTSFCIFLGIVYRFFFSQKRSISFFLILSALVSFFALFRCVVIAFLLGWIGIYIYDEIYSIIYPFSLILELGVLQLIFDAFHFRAIIIELLCVRFQFRPHSNVVFNATRTVSIHFDENLDFDHNTDYVYECVGCKEETTICIIDYITPCWYIFICIDVHRTHSYHQHRSCT